MTCRELISFLSPNLAWTTIKIMPLVIRTKVHVWNPAPLTEYHKRHARVVGTCMYHRPCFFNCNIGRQSWKADDMYTTPYVGFGVQPKMTILKNRSPSMKMVSEDAESHTPQQSFFDSHCPSKLRKHLSHIMAYHTQPLLTRFCQSN